MTATLTDSKPWDVISFGETMLRLTPPAGTRLESARSFESFVAGSESNTLSAMARLGLRVSWRSQLPDNPNGRRVAAELQSHGVDTRGVRWTPNARLGTFYAELPPAPLGPQVTYDRAGSAFATVNPDDWNLGGIADSRLLHLTGITPALGVGPRSLFDRALAIAADAGIALSFDINYRSRLWTAEDAAAAVEKACAQARVLICARGDAQVLWGIEGEPHEVVNALQERFGSADQPKTIVVTCGAQGSVMLDGDRYEASEAFQCEGNHRFGSGDAFGAAFLTAWLNQPSSVGTAASPLRYGNAAAALKRCIAGDIAVITPGELEGLVGQSAGWFR